MVGLQALRAVEHERGRAGQCQHECQQLWPPLGAQHDWLHRSGLRIGLAGAPASAADRSAACEVAAAIVAATPRASAAASATVGHPLSLGNPPSPCNSCVAEVRRAAMAGDILNRPFVPLEPAALQAENERLKAEVLVLREQL